MEDHDQRFKLILQSFFPEWAKRFDLSQPEWLREEDIVDPPQGEKVRMDLVARLALREAIALGSNEPDHWLALVHIGVESAGEFERHSPAHAGLLSSPAKKLQFTGGSVGFVPPSRPGWNSLGRA